MTMRHTPRVPAAGSQRRLQALVAAGYPQAELARQLGLKSPGNLVRLLARGGDVNQATAAAVRTVYDRLWDKPPPRGTWRQARASDEAREHARLMNWPVPMAWDDDIIDDPEAPEPAGWRRPEDNRRPAAVVLEEYAELKAQGCSDERIAMRLGMSPKAMQRARTRAAKYERESTGGNTMTRLRDEPVRDGHNAATALVTGLADAGHDPDVIDREVDDSTATLISKSGSKGADVYARSFAGTAKGLVRDLREAAREEPEMTPGKAHPDPQLAARGWQVGKHGIYERRAEQELEAG